MSTRISAFLSLFSVLAALACGSTDDTKSSASNAQAKVGSLESALVGDAGLDAGDAGNDAGDAAP
jgi:hypothetical protein